jgi:hypothetical protein
MIFIDCVAIVLVSFFAWRGLRKTNQPAPRVQPLRVRCSFSLPSRNSLSSCLQGTSAYQPASRSPLNQSCRRNRRVSKQLLRGKGIEATEKLVSSTNSKIVVIGAGKNGLPLILDAKEKRDGYGVGVGGRTPFAAFSTMGCSSPEKKTENIGAISSRPSRMKYEIPSPKE